MASETCLRLLSTRTSWFMDGTFKVAPRLFKQLFTVHVMLEGKVIPCAYALMASKSKRSYQRVFRELKDYVENMHLPELHPVSIMTDFEQAMLNAIDDEFPLAQSRGCLFHYTQCIWRKIQYLGLQPPYNEGGDLQDVCRQIMALPFLPVDDIPLAFAWVEEWAQDLSPAMIELIGYVDRQWVDNASLQRSRWNCHNIDVGTNNGVDGWHSRFNRKVAINHPNIWAMFGFLHSETARSELLVAQIEGGARIPVGRTLYTRLNERMQVLEHRRVNNEVDTLEFLTGVGRLIHF